MPGTRAPGGMRAPFPPEALPCGRAGLGGGDGGREAGAGYGLPILDGRFTVIPQVGYRFASGGRTPSLGRRLTPAGLGRDLTPGLPGTRRETA